MKKLALICIVITALTASVGCQKSGTTGNGQLVGVQDRPKWDHINPFGMVYIPSGTFHSGPSDEDVNNSLIQRSRSKSIQGFYMDDTEVTNNEYRQFVNYVRDSIAHGLLDHYTEDDNGNKKIDWTYEIDWTGTGGAEGDAGSLDQMFYSGDDQYWGRKELNTTELVFSYEWYDWKAAAQKAMRDNARSSFIRKEEVKIYPDTLVWIHDFSYSYNEPMTRNYFWHPSFDDYPVVGVNWNQANAFCAWRTKIWRDYAAENGETMGEEFRLPFEHEWEYAARGGLEAAPYPWGGPYVRNSKGCLLANFKPGRGNYPEDGGFYTVRADSYHPNDYGLYNMAGNVSEWTSTAFYENQDAFGHDMNTDIRYDASKEDPETLKRKVIRGGSWKDIAYYIQTGSRHWEYQDTSKSYIGFRSALTFLGRSIDDKY
ncbi:gliding motility-associated lipoprotein [Sphingobacteriales bacterium UPWRP_1]|nr:gliding motility-associated lipoprotein [Sphingobacteriales bacterium TSM_CSS]PSJ72622.1 gliding motility-associated lipoprotein [Sphingobacteriales bacterium UPWRP_1]